MFSRTSESERPPTVLCVDDEADGLRLRTLILEDSGYTVLSSTHPARALDMIEAQQVDAAVVDYHMPCMDGAALSASLKKRKPYLKVIMLSGSLVPQQDLKCVDSFVSKGDGTSQLLRILASYFPGHELPATRTTSNPDTSRGQLCIPIADTF